MLQIAICDDMDDEIRPIVALVNEYLTLRSMIAEVRVFSHPDALLTACEKGFFHIYLLDMVMPMVSGLELGREIRRHSSDAQIIYITTEPAFALDAYAVNPLHYLIKPVDKAKLFSVLDLAAEKVDYGQETTVTVKTKNGLRTISTDTIALCEYKRHAVIYILRNGETIETTTISGSFSEHIAPLLRNQRFIQPHAAFAVNMNCVERLDRDGFMLENSAFVPVSGKQYTAVRNAYMSYRLRGM
ncbi:MAG: response regulator transcription factor [Erysipelotrichia bacterium]|nr:response regulator transcription factor [Erysipelotrichia bacterium]